MTSINYIRESNFPQQFLEGHQGYLQRLAYLISFGHAVKIDDLAVLTFTSPEEVLAAIAELHAGGLQVISDGRQATIIIGEGVNDGR